MSLQYFTNNIKIFVNNLYKSYNKLDFINKLFIIFLLLLFSCVILKNITNKKENFKNDEIGTNKANYSKKFDNQTYDKYFSNKYDNIYLNPKRNDFEIKKIKEFANKDSSKILDIGCGTGYNVNMLTKDGYNITGIDQSKDMINTIKKTYDNCNVINEDILNATSLTYNDYDIITCLGRTLYEIKDKETFFENCYSLLEDNGLLIINVVDREKFKPYDQNTNSKNVLFNPEKYNKHIDNIIVKFNNKLEFTSKYNNLYDKSNDDKYDMTNNNSLPYASYLEEFTNFANSNPVNKKYERHLYIPKKEIIKKLAESKGFSFDNKISLNNIGLDNEYLYIFRK